MCLAWDVDVLRACLRGRGGRGGSSRGLGLGNAVESGWFGSPPWGVGMEQELLGEVSPVCKARDHPCCPGSGRCSQSCLLFCHVPLGSGLPSPGFWLWCTSAGPAQDLRSQATTPGRHKTPSSLSTFCANSIFGRKRQTADLGCSFQLKRALPGCRRWAC